MTAKLASSLAVGFLFAALSAGGAQPWIVENASLRVTMEPDGALSLLEKASGDRWIPEVPEKPVVKLDDVTIRNRGRVLESVAAIDGTCWNLRVELADSDPEVGLSLSAPARTPLKSDLEYPFALRAPGPEYRLVLPHKTGLLFRVEDAAALERIPGRYGCYAAPGLSMPWFGLTNLARGLLVLIETPADAGLDARLSGSGGDRVFAPHVYWQPSRGTAGYARKLRYRLLEGGYVAMAKHYRSKLIAAGDFVTLREKQQVHPQLEKLIGALDLHLRGNDAEQLEVVKSLESKGVKRMLINSGASKETLAWMRERGHLAGAYRIYTDIHPPRPGLAEALARGYPDDAYTQQDGSPVRGFAYSDARKTTYRCSLRQVPLMLDLVPALVREKGYEALFLDVVSADGPRECYATGHPLDRTEDMRWRAAILRYTSSLGVVVGSEDGNAWAAPFLHYLEGMAMPRRFGYIRGVTVGNWPQKFDFNDEYIRVDLNERVRVPLWDLVFHDAVVSTWRWNFTPDRYPEMKWWDKHDLLLMIAGSMPIFLVNREHLDQFGDRIVESYRRCSEWNAKTGWDELVDHRALTDDRSVQESRFSSGWAVVVNFSDTESYVSGDGEIIGARSFKLSTWK
ncbi:MAG: hypothetical protein HY238_00505 [Acidobacteria bacterium]|nr:hypothetical protein [Acidobacteriota bacterium]